MRSERDWDEDETVYVSTAPGPVWAIRFKVLDLAVGRVQVAAECAEPVVLDYFKGLLEAIGETYPGARETINSYLVPEQETDGGDDKPRVPKRGKDLRRWKNTWRVLKTKEAQLGSYEKISKWLEKMHRPLAVSPDTVADIIRAGDAGLLDS
ncbi:unnamed protein product [marine sediment metagenome]|uniref:Uncharacterized protein n=1 Tax=marine sediment metagenome TaxID=412755 RepID=X0US98_9ZZZZ